MKNQLINLAGLGGVGFISYHLLRQEYHSHILQKYHNREEDIQRGLLPLKDVQKYQRAKLFFEQHEGFNLIKNIEATNDILQDGKKKLLQLESQRQQIYWKKQQGKISDQEAKQELSEIDKISNEINSLLDQIPITGGSYDLMTQEEVARAIAKFN